MQVWKTRQPHTVIRQAATWCRVLLGMGLSLIAVQAQALQNDAKTAADLAAPITQTVSPYVDEKTTTPYSLKQENGYQVGGINNNLKSSGGLGSLSLQGGMYYSRTLAPSKLLDGAPIPDSRLGQDATGLGNQQSSGMARAFLFGGHGAQSATTDQVTYQKLEYRAGGLSLSGSYADVGSDFQGLDKLVRNMKAGDPTGAAMLNQGMRQTNYALKYDGVRGLNFATSAAEVQNGQQGHKEYGLTRSTQTTSVGMALGQKQRVDYTVSNLTETWDPTKAKRPNDREVETQALVLTGGIGQKSQFSLGQTTTTTTAGGQQTDVEQRDLSVKWAESKNLSLNGSYQTKVTEQTQEQSDTLSLDLNAALSPRTQVSGKLVQSTTAKPKDVRNPGEMQTTEKGQVDLKVVSKLTNALQLTSQYQDVTAPDKGDTTALNHQVVWALSPNWRLSARLNTADTVKQEKGTPVTLSTRVTEYGLNGQIGTTAQPQTLGFTTRTEQLPNDVLQQRNELTYTRALGTKQAPVTLQAQAGTYGLTKKDAAKDADLLTLQLLTARPNKRMTLSLGYYDGPVLGARALAYRSWGLKPTGNEEVWRNEDFTHYSELGGQLEWQLADDTKIVVKQFSGQLGDAGQQGTVEYGIEQHLGSVIFQGGRRTTTQPGKPNAKGDAAQVEADESWWQVAIPTGKKLPTWTATSLRPTVFEDSLAWGVGDLPKWVEKPSAGFTVARQLVQVGGKPADLYSASYGAMLRDNLFLQAGYARNPSKLGKPNELELGERTLIHMGYAVNPKVQLFARYITEETRSANVTEYTRTLGMSGRLSAVERLQLQIDDLARVASGKELNGTAYVLEYERAVSDEDSFLVKARLQPEEFSSKQDRVRLEARYQRTF